MKKTQQIYEIEGKKYALIGEKLIPIESSTPSKKQENVQKTVQKTHKKQEIPQIITGMTKQETIDVFGDMTLNPKETPYLCSVEKFFNLYGIELRERKDGSKEKPFLSRALRHQVILKQLTGENKTRFNTVKTNCMKFLKEKIDAIPEKTDNIPLQKKREHNLTEYNRWENEQYKA